MVNFWDDLHWSDPASLGDAAPDRRTALRFRRDMVRLVVAEEAGEARPTLALGRTAPDFRHGGDRVHGDLVVSFAREARARLGPARARAVEPDRYPTPGLSRAAKAIWGGAGP